MISKSVTSIFNIFLNPARSSILNSLILLKYPLSLLHFTHFLVFPLWGFSSSEFINSCNTTSGAMFTILNYWMKDFWHFELYNVGCNMLDESLRMTIISGFIEHLTPSKILSNTNIKCWIIYWVHLRRPLYSKFCYIFGSSHHMLSLRVYF